jgi:hypothetical protein
MVRAKNEIKDFATGQVTVIEIPWTESELREQIAAWRWQREAGGITVGNQPISTFKDEMPVWLGFKDDAKERIDAGITTFQYKYKPRGGTEFATFSQKQVLRAFQCFKWYVGACFDAEDALLAMITSGVPLDQVAAAAQDPATWPQTTFAWEEPA